MSSSGQNLNQSILEVVTYFDLFSYPLTALEIWMNLRVRTSYGEVLEQLRVNRWLHARLFMKNGMWGLKRREGNIGERRSRYRTSVLKLKKARRFARLLNIVPGIQAVFACNALGFLNTKPEGDSDLFVVARRGRIWLSRFLAVLCAELIGGRPKRAHAKDGLCLSFFATEGADMGRLSLRRDGDSVSGYGDVYYLYWMSKLMPLFAHDGVLERFWERNRWVRDQLPHLQPIRTPAPYIIQGTSHRPRKTILWKIGNRAEGAARALQIKIMPAYLKDVANQGTAVVVSDDILKFHDHDRRAYFREEFERRVAAVA